VDTEGWIQIVVEKITKKIFSEKLREFWPIYDWKRAKAYYVAWKNWIAITVLEPVEI